MEGEGARRAWDSVSDWFAGTAPNVADLRDMLEMMGANPRLDAAAIQTVGTKGWDGFAVAIVKEPVE